MRMLLEFQLEKNELPIETRRLALSYIKHAIEKNNLELYNNQYDGSAKLKDMVFAMYYPIKSINKNQVILKNNVMSLRIGTSDLAYGIQLYNAFQEQLKEVYKYQTYSVKLNRITLEKESRIFHEVIRIKMLSPLLVRNNSTTRDTYLLPHENEFQSRFNEVVNAQIEKIQGNHSNTDIRITPVKTKKVVIKHYGQYIDGSLGEFIIEGHPTLLNFLYHSGIGSRRSYGFGMFEII